VPFTLTLPEPWASRGCKVKIRDRERVEPPHVTILHRTRAWPFDLGRGSFLDREPDRRHVPEEVLDTVRANLPVLRTQWDRMFPENPVFTQERDDE
jgi:hypothetical protein